VKLNQDIYDLAVSIKRSQGRREYFAKPAKLISDKLMERGRPTTFHVRDHTGPDPFRKYQGTLRTRRAYIRRSPKLAALRKDHPKVYSELVTETPAPFPYTVTLRSVKFGTTCEEWTDVMAAGQESARNDFLAKWEHITDEQWTFPDTRSRVLWTLREQMARIKRHEEMKRRELAALCAAHDMRRIPGRRDGLIVVSDAAPKREVDIDALLALPGMGDYVTISRVEEQTSFVIREVIEKRDDPNEDDEEPFEGD